MAKCEEVAEIADLLVHLALRLRLTAVIVVCGVVERAVETAVQVGPALQTRVASADALDASDVGTTPMTTAPDRPTCLVAATHAR